MSLIRTKEDYTKYINRISVIPYGLYGPTPDGLIENMVNQIDVDWKNPNLKILDPGFGFGGFLFFVYLKLKQYHSDEHILNNMIYGIEIEPFRFTLVKEKFKIKNLFNDDYINPSSELKRILNMKFDVIIGNPPYQNANHNAKKDSLWKLFIKKSNEISNGKIYFVIPASFTSPTGLFDFYKNRISFIDLTIKKYFPNVGSSFCSVLIENELQDKSKISTNSGQISVNMDTMDCIPYNLNEEILNTSKLIFKNNRKWNLSCEYHTQKENIFDENGSIEVIHSTKIKKTNIQHENNKKIRVHISVTNDTKFSIANGVGLTQNHIWTEFFNMEDAIKYCDYLNSEEVQATLQNYRWSNMNYKQIISKL